MGFGDEGQQKERRRGEKAVIVVRGRGGSVGVEEGWKRGE